MEKQEEEQEGIFSRIGKRAQTIQGFTGFGQAYDVKEVEAETKEAEAKEGEDEKEA